MFVTYSSWDGYEWERSSLRLAEDKTEDIKRPNLVRTFSKVLMISEKNFRMQNLDAGAHMIVRKFLKSKIY